MITDHSIDNYITRVKGVPLSISSEELRKEAHREIKKALEDPESIIQSKKSDCPIHIRGDVAIPVKEDHVPTTYNSETFKKKAK